jgi:hypothetical protein
MRAGRVSRSEPQGGGGLIDPGLEVAESGVDRVVAGRCLRREGRQGGSEEASVDAVEEEGDA